MASITDSLTRLGDLSVPFTPVSVTGWGDAELLASQGRIAEVRRRLDAVAATVAGEIAHRSRRELGHAGLAQSEGLRTPEELIAKVSGTSTRDARTLMKTAELLPARELAPDAAPVPRWQRLIGDAVAAATISVEAAELIRTRLIAAEGVDENALATAAGRLLAEASGLTIEQLAIRAGRVRDELDLAGIAEREQELRAKRFLRVSPQLDGMTRVTGLLDPESAAIVVPILDAATSPRRGGPRFVNPDAVQRVEDIMRDERSTEQLALDTLVELVRIGSRVDDGKLLGDRKPAVRILVTRTDLDARVGAAFFEGQSEAVSVQTAERFICATGAIPILFDDDGKALNLGREHRLFSEKQRTAMAARDGGCLMCGRPPSWCEAHHIDHWDEHDGRTDIDSGVLLCRFCHLTVHNNRWRIRRDGGDYLLEKPDPNGVLRHTSLPSRSPALSRLLAG
ncbi:HNH endonuclease signature motif containing protein [Protaetiibacter mangrovi]|uniref:HNH endonuclease n=1 Tax=Protaetiibacter mangrovi TaxID=2970926 RepID=A0ABT1ZIW6_9MICO|nr:HNH endonuclease signature motif containing protein [Protaetiibacter mangrovi]MCS0500670.1 HNH endonuclease [Protaetiibacter mangrovi]